MADETTQSESFYKVFRQELTEIEKKIKRLPSQSSTGGEHRSAIDDCYAAINKLSDETLQASVYLAPHDRRTYGEAIVGLREQLAKAQDVINPKKKFSFKSGSARTGGSSQASSAKAQSEDTGLSTKEQGLDAPSDPNHATTGVEVKAPDMETTPSHSSRTKPVNFEDHNRQHLLIPAYSDAEACSGSIINVHRCVIHMKMVNEGETGTPLASLTMKNVSDSLIVCGNINGPVHLTGITNSIIAVASQQFRMHESRNCDVYLHSSSRPIIEDCEGIRFAPLLEQYQVERAYGTEDQWREVDDFNWHRLEPSPNWRVMDVEQRLKAEVWRDVVPGGPSKGPEDILRAVGIVKESF